MDNPEKPKNISTENKNERKVEKDDTEKAIDKILNFLELKKDELEKFNITKNFKTSIRDIITDLENKNNEEEKREYVKNNYYKVIKEISYLLNYGSLKEDIKSEIVKTFKEIGIEKIIPELIIAYFMEGCNDQHTRNNLYKIIELIKSDKIDEDKKESIRKNFETLYLNQMDEFLNYLKTLSEKKEIIKDDVSEIEKKEKSLFFSAKFFENLIYYLENGKKDLNLKEVIMIHKIEKYLNKKGSSIKEVAALERKILEKYYPESISEKEFIFLRNEKELIES